MAACATLDSTAAGDTTTAVGGSGGSIQIDSIPIVDLRLLSQSELYSLSLCSSSAAFNPNRCDDVVIPKIDRSVFNESAGSRKQTYSRLRLAPPSSSASASPSAAPRRRTPHLRPTASTFSNSSSNNFDPENAENAHIVTLLKSLFASDVNVGVLVPVRIEYSDSASDLGKRKREVLENEIEISVVGVSDNVDVFSSNVEDMDREVLNRDGVAVDLVALGAVEHLYSEEIRQRTQLLGTEEELLGFLKGLKGQWGSRRKKKRIVDACDFGTALPVGWKLLLSIKKKNGLIWLYCRRYLSPSGRQFVSCKEVSSYLISLHGTKDTTTCNEAQHDEPGAADKLNSTCMAYQDVGRKDNLVLHAPSPAFATISGNHDMQIILDAGELSKERLGETLHCKKCNITFSEKNELLQHQSSLHRKTRNKNGVKITDGVIIKDGKYECQFCHKTFDERHRYNGHVGAHVRYQKIAGESSQTVAVDYSLGVQDTGTKGFDNVPEICDVSTNNGLNSFSPSYEDNELVRDLREDNGNMRDINVATVIVTSASPCSAAETDLSSNENKSSHGIMNGLLEISASMENPKQDMVPECSLFDSTNHVKACANNGLKGGEFFSANESMFDFFGSCDPLDKDVAVGVKQASHFEGIPCKIFGTTDNTLTCASMESELNLESNVSLLGPPQDERACSEVGKYTFDEIYSFETPCEEGSSKADNIAISRPEEIQFGIDSVIPSWSEQKNVTKKYDNVEQGRVCSSFASESGKQFCREVSVFNSALEEHKQQPSRTSSVLPGVSQVPDEACTVNNKTTKISEIANTGKHDELSLSFGDLHSNSNRDLNIMNSHLKQGRSFGIDVCDSSSNDRLHGSFSVSQPRSDWNGPTQDNITTSGQKFMVDFVNTGDCMIADGSWSIGQPNVFQGSFDATASSQPPSCFETFDLTSYKGEEGSFGVISRPNRSEPVEYSFMGNESSNSQPSKSMERGIDTTSFWLGNTSVVCVWCRNIFYEEQVAAQTVGAIGSLCPSCTSTIPGGQFNG